MIVLCENKDCKHCFNGKCSKMILKMDCDGGCFDFEPFHTCGECAKFDTVKCFPQNPSFRSLVEDGDAACLACFEMNRDKTGTEGEKA